jgi:NACHT domain
MAYFYFDFRDTSKQNRRDLLPSLVIQLSSRSDSCCNILSHLYLAHDSGAQKPSEDKLIECLKKMIALPDQPPVYVIIDALDECPDSSGMPSPRELVLDLLKDLIDLSLPNFHLCVTSRPEIDIRNSLEPLTSRRVSLHDQTGQKRDIIDYVASVVNSDAKMRRCEDGEMKINVW